MLDTDTKRRIDNARDILVGKVPDPKAQVEQITTALIYKFMDDMDKESEELGGKPKFFANSSKKYSWSKLMDAKMGGFDRLNLYSEAIAKMSENPHLPQLFRDIFKDAFLPFRDPETLNLFLKEINGFVYDHSERLGDAYEYLLSVLGSQGDAGQFRTPRHIIDFIVKVVDPKKDETVLDPACGTAGFLISAFKHIQGQNTKTKKGDKLTPDEKKKLMNHFIGYDISPDMVRLSLVNMYLHDFPNPNIHEYDTLTSEDRWDERYDVILANPPFMTPKGGIRPHKRFSVQANRSEVLFVDYIAEHLNNSGRAGVIVPEGIIFQSANAYTALRKMLTENGYLYAVVSLPAGVFNPYSGVKTSILLMDKRIAKMATDILFVKVDNDGFGLGAQRREIAKNDLPQAHIEIGEYLRCLRTGESLDDFQPVLGQIVSKEKIALNGEYNLSGERYREGAVRSQSFPSYPLSDVCNIFNGSTPSKQEPRYWENGTVPWFTVEDIRKGGRIIGKTEKFVTDDGLKETSLKLLPKHSVLLCCTASVGEYAFTEIEVTTNQQFNGLVVNRAFADRLMPKFLFFISSRFKDELLRLSGKTAFNFVSVGSLKTIQIPLPPLEVQQEIVAEIDGYQKIIDGAKQVVSNYRPYIPIHPNWLMVELGEICERIQYGLSNPLNKEGFGFKTFRMNELVEGRCIDFGNMKLSDIPPEEFRKYRLERGDILFNRTNSFEHVGRTGIFDLPGDYCFASYLIRLTIAKKKANPFFVTAFMNSESFQQGIKQYATRAIGQSNINAKNLASYPIPLPPLATQQQIVAEIEAEQVLVGANKKLIEIFERKIKSRIAEVWGEEEKSI